MSGREFRERGIGDEGRENEWPVVRIQTSPRPLAGEGPGVRAVGSSGHLFVMTDSVHHSQTNVYCSSALPLDLS
jgi:hypothetical protein